MAALPLAAALATRAPLLAADLAALGAVMPAPLDLQQRDDAAAWGTLYVVEGSRLGGALLLRGVPAGSPASYLGAIHPPGGWRMIRAAIDAAAAAQDAAWHERMVAGALETFDLYARAA